MTEHCIFRVQFVGSMWRVMESDKPDKSGQYRYRIMHNRVIYEKFMRTNGRGAIEQCMRYALGVGIDIYWGSVL